MDDRRVTLLGLLDLSAAFDTMDYSILLRRLQGRSGFDGIALQWIGSFLSDRTQQVQFHNIRSATAHLICLVPQGSVLGPLLFLLYTAELFSMIEGQGLKALVRVRFPNSTSACLPRRHCLLFYVSCNVWSMSNSGWEAIVDISLNL